MAKKFNPDINHNDRLDQGEDFDRQDPDAQLVYAPNTLKKLKNKPQLHEKLKIPKDLSKIPTPELVGAGVQNSINEAKINTELLKRNLISTPEQTEDLQDALGYEIEKNEEVNE